MSLAQSLLLDFEDEKEGVDSNDDVDHSATCAAGESHRQLQFLDPQKQSPVDDSDQESKVRRNIQDDGDPELENELDRILNDPQIDKFIGKKSNDVNAPALLDKNLEQYNDFSEANSYIKKINLASERLHKKLVHIYSKRFLHLASLIPNPELYVLAVKELKNEPSSVKFNENLPKILSNSVIMNMSLSQFASPGDNLSEEELKICETLIDKFENLNEKKMVLLEFIEIHLTKLAPNLTKLLGTSIAAQLLTSVGGLNNLVTIPSCDVHLIGSERIVTATGALSYSKQNGIVYSTDIVINTSPVI
ncbi:MAG: U4/U6 small nuclear ribonucleoprotein Prp31 [Marteilia pararefringens]